jgi:hypothetical protein
MPPPPRCNADGEASIVLRTTAAFAACVAKAIRPARRINSSGELDLQKTYLELFRCLITLGCAQNACQKVRIHRNNMLTSEHQLLSTKNWC